MSLAQISPEISGPVSDPRDGLLGDTRLLGVSNEEFWANQSAAHARREGDISRPQTHDEYLEAGLEKLGLAVETEQRLGLDSAAHIYHESQIEFLGAIGTMPIVDGAPEDPDPVLLIQYATTLDKQSQASKNVVPPYENGRDRRKDLGKTATKTFQLAGEMIRKGEIEPDDESLVPAAVVVADGLANHGKLRDAGKVLSETKAALHDQHTDPELEKFMEQHTDHGRDKTTRREVAAVALADLATGSHELLTVY